MSLTDPVLKACQDLLRTLPIYIDKHSTTLYIPLPPALLVHYPALQCYEDAVKEGEKSGIRPYRK